MADRPIIFSAPMVRAILDGRKTQTRRILKPQPRGTPWLSSGPDDGHEPGWFDTWEEGRAPCGAAVREVVAPLKGLLWRPGDRAWVKHSYSAHHGPYFRPIASCPGYAAGTDGLIYRMDRGTPRALKGTRQPKGYLTVTPSVGGIWRTISVHRLVAEAFYGAPPFDGAQVRHLDNNPANNLPTNLLWGSQSENWHDRRKIGSGMGCSHPWARLTPEAVRDIRASTDTQRALAKRYGVAQSTIQEVLAGKTWAEPPSGDPTAQGWAPWRSPIHMPRWASRITLLIEDVRAQRLQDISEEDARAEGVEPILVPPDGGSAPHIEGFRETWAAIHAPDAWQANPWVAALRFRAVPRNIDALAADLEAPDATV